MIEQRSFQCAFVAKNVSEDKPSDSFLVVLSHHDKRKFENSLHTPKFLRFNKSGNYWLTAEYEHSDLTCISGMSWDEFRSQSEDFKNAFRAKLNIQQE